MNQQKAEECEAISLDVVTMATGLVVTTDDELSAADQLLSFIKPIKKEIEDVFGPPIKAAYAAHREIIAARKKVEDPILKAEKSVKKAMGGYHDRLRFAAETERRAEAAKLRKQEEDRRLAQAQDLQDKGAPKSADALLEKPIEPRAPIITAPPPPKAEHSSKSVKFAGSVFDHHEFGQWALKQGRLREFFTLKQSALDSAIQKVKGEITIPGVEVTSETVVSHK